MTDHTFKIDEFSGIWNIIKTVDWSERWLQILLVVHAVSLFITFRFRKYTTFQAIYFVFLLSLVYFSEKLNELGAKYWKKFAKHQYFDSNGLFISIFLSTPLLLNCLLQIDTLLSDSNGHSSGHCPKVLVERCEAHRFVSDCMTKVGVGYEQAKDLANLLSMADYQGHFSHGLNRLGIYVEDVMAGATSNHGKPLIISETVSMAWVDGQNILGPSSAIYCMNVAINKASQTGIGIVCCKNANHFGIAGYYSHIASERGMIGLAFSNTAPCHVPTRGKEILLGANPIAMNAPSKNGDYFSLDMATSVVAYGKVEINEMEGKAIPMGWGVNKEGNLSRDPNHILNGGAVLPLGGLEETGGYKGYGLCLMVEILTGILSGSSYGHHIKRWTDKSRPANLGHCFLAINPVMFAPDFEHRIDDMMKRLRNSQTIPGKDKVLVAGDPERISMDGVDKRGGILYHPNIIKKLNELAESLKISPILTMNVKDGDDGKRKNQ